MLRARGERQNSHSISVGEVVHNFGVLLGAVCSHLVVWCLKSHQVSVPPRARSSQPS